MTIDHETHRQPAATLFDQTELVLVPAEPTGMESMPSVTLGPHVGIDLDEFVAMMGVE